MAWAVVISPRLMLKVSLMALTAGASPFMMQEAQEAACMLDS